jgi:hypothetical protein
VLREAAGPDDEYDIELALIAELVHDFENAVNYAESDEEIARAREAIDAARSLHRAVMALVAAPGSHSDDPE